MRSSWSFTDKGGCDDGRGLLDRDQCPLVWLQVLLGEPHDFGIETITLTASQVDRVDVVEGLPIPLDLVDRLPLGSLDLLDDPRPATEGDVWQVGNDHPVSDPDLGSRLKAG